MPAKRPMPCGVGSQQFNLHQWVAGLVECFETHQPQEVHLRIWIEAFHNNRICRPKKGGFIQRTKQKSMEVQQNPAFPWSIYEAEALKTPSPWVWDVSGHRKHHLGSGGTWITSTEDVLSWFFGYTVAIHVKTPIIANNNLVNHYPNLSKTSHLV